MSRTLPSAVQTEIEKRTGAEITHLLRIDHSGGTIRWTTATRDVDADVGDGAGAQTWISIGGALEVGIPEETDDRRAQGLRLSLSGVDQTIISVILSNELRGRFAYLHRAWLADDGTVAGTLELFRGLQNREYRVEEDSPQEGREPTCTVSTRVVSRLVELQRHRMVRTNLTSHQQMLERAGVPDPETDDFFKFVPTLQDKEIRWGSEGAAGGSGGRDQTVPDKYYEPGNPGGES